MREKEGKEAAEAERAGRLLSSMGQNRSLNSEESLVLLKRTKLFSYRLQFNSFSKKG